MLIQQIWFCTVFALTSPLLPAQEQVSKNQHSLNDMDRIAFGVGKTPFDRELKPLTWKAADHDPATAESGLRISLDGRWDLKEAPQHGVSEQSMLFGEEGWKDAIPARIPNSVQTCCSKPEKFGTPCCSRITKTSFGFRSGSGG